MSIKLVSSHVPLLKIFQLKNTAMLLCGAMLLSACANNNIVKLEASVKQLQDLHDHDRDGVIEARDKCANTVLGATIDNNGCGIKSTQLIPLKMDIKFPHDSYELPPSALPAIQKLAKIVAEKQDLQILIEGHTSKIGSEEYNQTLSENRAKAAEVFLVKNFNIPSERVSSVGYGFQRLADNGNTETAHETNRRIMAELSKTVNVDDMRWTIYTVDQAK